MKRTSTLWPALILTLGAYAAPALAQTPSPAPPKLDKIEEIGDDSITINSKPEAAHQITQKRSEDGRITEETVKSGPSTYTVHTAPPTGTAMPGDAMSHTNRGPQWTVLQFDLGKKKKTEKDEDSSAGAPPPPPPATK